MDELVRWLGEQLDEDERSAKGATPGPWRYNPDKHHHLAGTPMFEEAVFAGQPGGDAICVAGTGGTDDPQSMRDAAFIARHDPARVLREIDAKRQLVAETLAEPHLYNEEDNWYTCAALVDQDGEPVCLNDSRAPGPCDCGRDARVGRRLRLLALPYAGRPGYRAEWRP